MLIRPPERPRILELYMSGLSTRQVARVVGTTPGAVAYVCKGLRSKSEAGMLAHPPTSTHPRSSRAAARKLYQRTHKVTLPTEVHVHHKDEDYTNGAIENLQALNRVAHAKLHHPKNPIPRHRRPGRIESVTRQKQIPATCLSCGKKFLGNKYTGQETCSHSCGARLFWKRRRQ